LHPQEVVVRDHGRIDDHQVGGGRLLDFRDKVLPEGDQHCDGLGVEVALGAEVADEEAAIADVVAGLLQKLFPLARRDDAAGPLAVGSKMRVQGPFRRENGCESAEIGRKRLRNRVKTVQII
jgi:hypothetical protein